MDTTRSRSIPSTTQYNHRAESRLASLDALRGLVMFLLLSHSLGLEPFLEGDHPIMRPIAQFFRHAYQSYGWLQGPQTVWDMIMPTFMFVMGVSMFLSGKCRISANNGPRIVLVRAMKRSAILYFLGNIIRGVQTRELTFDVFGVLPQIANIYLCTTLILLLPRRRRVPVVVALLVSYACLFECIPPPNDFGISGPHSQYAERANIGSYIDKILFHETFPWVFIAVVPFSAITTLGYWCGSVVRSDRPEPEKEKRFVGGGLLAIGFGWLLSLWIPFERCLMTVSFTVFSAGIVLLSFTILYWTMDVKGRKAWAFPLVVIGSNAIVIYFIAMCTFPFLPDVTLIFTGPIVNRLEPALGAMFNYWVGTFLYFLLSLWLYRSRLFIRV